jgi:hypothetical protein
MGEAVTDLPAAPPARDPDAGTQPVVAAVCLLGVLLTGLCLVAADRLDRSGPARTLAVLAVVTALVAVLVALGGQLASVLTRPGRGARAVLAAGLLSMLAVLLAGAAAVIAVQPAEPETKAAPSTEPTLVVQRDGAVSGATPVTALLSFPGLKTGSVVDATMTGVGGNPEPVRYVLARSSVRAGADGPAVVRLTASADPGDEVTIEVKAPDRTCSMRLPPPGTDDGATIELACTRI